MVTPMALAAATMVSVWSSRSVIAPATLCRAGSVSGRPSTRIWSKGAGKATLRLKDKDGKVVKEMSVNALKGYNFVDFSLLLTPGKPGTATLTKPKTGAEAVKDPLEAERPKFLEAGDYTLEIEIGGKTTSGSWKLTPAT